MENPSHSKKKQIFASTYAHRNESLASSNTLGLSFSFIPKSLQILVWTSLIFEQGCPLTVGANCWGNSSFMQWWHWTHRWVWFGFCRRVCFGRSGCVSFGHSCQQEMEACQKFTGKYNVNITKMTKTPKQQADIIYSCPSFFCKQLGYTLGPNLHRQTFESGIHREPPALVVKSHLVVARDVHWPT